MDSLTPEEKAELSKASTERLKAKLVAANVSETIVNAMDRAQMLDAVAKLKQLPVVATAKPIDANDLFNLLRFEHETRERRFEEERRANLERAELAERARRADIERAERERAEDRRREEERMQYEMSAREREYQLH